MWETQSNRNVQTNNADYILEGDTHMRSRICLDSRGIEPTRAHNLPDKLRYRTFDARFWHRLL